MGSSVDPDIEDVGRWEEELRVICLALSLIVILSNLFLVDDVPYVYTAALPATTSASASELTPADLEDEELEAYAEECARRAALEDFEGLDDADLFEWSDDEDPVSATTAEENMDTDMAH